MVKEIIREFSSKAEIEIQNFIKIGTGIFGGIPRYSSKDCDEIDLKKVKEFEDNLESNRIFPSWVYGDFIGNYYLLNSNNIASIRGITPYIIQRSNGEYNVFLTDNKGYQKRYKMSHIIAYLNSDRITKESEKYTDIKFLDGNPTNLKPMNIMWRIPRSKGKHGHDKIVYQFSKEEELIRIFDSLSEAANSEGNLSKTNISACCNGKRKSHGGYIWSFTPLNKWDYTYK